MYYYHLDKAFVKSNKNYNEYNKVYKEFKPTLYLILRLGSTGGTGSIIKASTLQK